MGFNVFALETYMPAGFDVNEYVLTGRGDPEKALAGLGMWPWNIDEMLEFDYLDETLQRRSQSCKKGQILRI